MQFYQLNSPLLVLQAGNVSGVPFRILENPPTVQYSICDLFVLPLIVLVPKQVIVICVPSETCGCWGVIVAWGIIGTLHEELTV